MYTWTRSQYRSDLSWTGAVCRYFFIIVSRSLCIVMVMMLKLMLSTWGAGTHTARCLIRLLLIIGIRLMQLMWGRRFFTWTTRYSTTSYGCNPINVASSSRMLSVIRIWMCQRYCAAWGSVRLWFLNFNWIIKREFTT